MDLAVRVREDFGIPLIGVQPTGLGADARASLWRGRTADGTTYAVKTSSAPQPGLVVADFLARQGVAGVPAPVSTRSGGVTTDHEGGLVSIVPWIDGARAIDTGLDLQQWRAFGAVLGAVHATAPAAPLVGGAALLPVDRHDPGVEVGRARAFPARLRRAEAAAGDDKVIGELARLWGESGGDVLAVADLAESSARSGVWAAAEPVICHADPHHGNLLLAGDGDGVWLVDWDDAVLGPREADLIFVIGGVFSFAPITPADEQSFFDGYTLASGGVARADVDATRLTYYRSVRALTDFLDFADDALDLERAATERADGLRIAHGAVSPEGIVNLALSEAAVGH
ncbi:MAG: phosphotransferase [Pedococcus sp.]